MTLMFSLARGGASKTARLNERMTSHASRPRSECATGGVARPESPHGDGKHPPFPQRAPIITHYQHPVIQRIRQLRRRDAREQSGLYYVEGLRFVLQAVQHHSALEALVVCPPLLTHALAQRLVRAQRLLGVPIVQVTAPVMHQLALVDDPQGIGAVVRQRWEPLEHITPGNELCWIALHQVRSPGNLGTILRTSAAVGGAGIILLGKAVDPYDPATVRATMSSLYAQRLVRTVPAALAHWKRRHGFHLIGTSPGARTDYHAYSYRPPTILLMGDERKGLPVALQSLCDQMVRISMVGDCDSLNLGVATGVMLYELFNQRRTAPPQ
jgi:TrmH family RNA methyltransferase